MPCSCLQFIPFGSLWEWLKTAIGHCCTSAENTAGAAAAQESQSCIGDSCCGWSRPRNDPFVFTATDLQSLQDDIRKYGNDIQKYTRKYGMTEEEKGTLEYLKNAMNEEILVKKVVESEPFITRKNNVNNLTEQMVTTEQVNDLIDIGVQSHVGLFHEPPNSVLEAGTVEEKGKQEPIIPFPVIHDNDAPARESILLQIRKDEEKLKKYEEKLKKDEEELEKKRKQAIACGISFAEV